MNEQAEADRAQVDEGRTDKSEVGNVGRGLSGAHLVFGIVYHGMSPRPPNAWFERRLSFCRLAFIVLLSPCCSNDSNAEYSRESSSSPDTP